MFASFKLKLPKSLVIESRTRGLSVVFATVTAFLFCVTTPDILAAPITLGFTALVGPPPNGFDGTVPPGWGISLQEGDGISARFTFEPVDAPPFSKTTRVSFPYEFEISIKSKKLITTRYGVVVVNDSTSDDVPDPSDNILLGCSIGIADTLCNPITDPISGAGSWSFELALSGRPSLLDGADIPPDSSIWQQLIFPDSFGVVVTDDIANKGYGFIATPTDFFTVPEPSDLIVGLSFFALLALKHPQRYKTNIYFK